VFADFPQTLASVLGRMPAGGRTGFAVKQIPYTPPFLFIIVCAAKIARKKAVNDRPHTITPSR
jgi:hypothetical protein